VHDSALLDSAGTDPGVKLDLHWKDGVMYYFKS